MQDIGLFMQHHPALIAALAVVLVLLVILEFIKIKRGANRLTPAQTVQWMNHNNAAIIDIRNYEAFSTGHIVGAISLPLADLTNTEKLKKIEKFKNQPIVLVCAAGMETPRAATTLAQQGFNVQVLAGGIRAWRDAGMPLVKG